MNGFRSDDDLRLVNERIHALHVDAARQRLVRQAAAPTPTAAPRRSLGARPRMDPSRAARPARIAGRAMTPSASTSQTAFDRMGACV